jgi:uncharacterized protein YutE (UPF0331/DUF86 family)
MTPDFSYTRGRILASVNFVSKEIEDFEKHFSKITWKQYKLLDPLKAKALEKTVENILTALIEIAGTISVEKRKTIENYASAIKEASLILNFKEEKAETLSRLANQRNRLAHRYLDFKWEAIKAFKETKPLILEFLKKVISREKLSHL